MHGFQTGLMWSKLHIPPRILAAALWTSLRHQTDELGSPANGPKSNLLDMEEWANFSKSV